MTNNVQVQRPNERLEFFNEAMKLETDDCIIFSFGTERYGMMYMNDRQYRASVLACTHGHGEKPAGAHAIHGPCNNPRCINPRHLHWGTHGENMRDRRRDDTDNRGTRNGHNKLSEDDVHEIREALARGGITQTALGLRYGVSRKTISNIALNIRWAWLEKRA